MRVTLFISAVILSSDVGCGSLMTEGKIGLALASHEKQYKDDFLKEFREVHDASSVFQPHLDHQLFAEELPESSSQHPRDASKEAIEAKQFETRFNDAIRDENSFLSYLLGVLISPSKFEREFANFSKQLNDNVDLVMERLFKEQMSSKQLFEENQGDTINLWEFYSLLNDFIVHWSDDSPLKETLFDMMGERTWFRALTQNPSIFLSELTKRIKKFHKAIYPENAWLEGDHIWKPKDRKMRSQPNSLKMEQKSLQKKQFLRKLLKDQIPNFIEATELKIDNVKLQSGLSLEEAISGISVKIFETQQGKKNLIASENLDIPQDIKKEDSIHVIAAGPIHYKKTKEQKGPKRNLKTSIKNSKIVHTKKPRFFLPSSAEIKAATQEPPMPIYSRSDEPENHIGTDPSHPGAEKPTWQEKIFKIWESIKKFFSDRNNISRILVFLSAFLLGLGTTMVLYAVGTVFFSWLFSSNSTSDDGSDSSDLGGEEDGHVYVMKDGKYYKRVPLESAPLTITPP